MMRWYKDLKTVLAVEPEAWLAYLHGQRLHDLPHLVGDGTGAKGAFVLLIKHLYTILRNLSFFSSLPKGRHWRVLIFSGTYNQISSLHGVSEFLAAKGEHSLHIAPASLLDSVNPFLAAGYIPFKLNFLDVSRSLVLLVLRGWGLYFSLGTSEDRRKSRYYFFNEFLNSYIYLVYFYRVLGKLRPLVVLISNDHSTANRALLAVAHHYGIKTAYLQHASVSSIFPALRLNFAFLDGQHAADVYASCKENLPASASVLPYPKIYLTGQQRPLEHIDDHPPVVGIALNLLDKRDDAIILIDCLLASGLQVCLRWHPRQGDKDVSFYYQRFSGNEFVYLSDPKDQGVAAFMRRISWLVAGNSSIHLEAALSGVLPVYYEFSETEIPDYYGYVKHGLAKAAETADDVAELVRASMKQERPDVAPVQYYSASYATEWQGREGERVACLLLELLDKLEKSAFKSG